MSLENRQFSLRIRLDIPNMHKELIIVRHVVGCEHDALGIWKAIYLSLHCKALIGGRVGPENVVCRELTRGNMLFEKNVKPRIL
jgi:hypothetical protein